MPADLLRASPMTSMMKSKAPELSVIIPWSNRPEIKTTLDANGPLFGTRDVEVIVVNCGGDNSQLLELLRGPAVASLRCVELTATTFNKSLALNLGPTLRGPTACSSSIRTCYSKTTSHGGA